MTLSPSLRRNGDYELPLKEALGAEDRRTFQKKTDESQNILDYYKLQAIGREERQSKRKGQEMEKETSYP